MAKEAIETVRAAEDKAASLIESAELSAKELVAAAAEKAKRELDNLIADCKAEEAKAKLCEAEALKAALEGAESDIAAKCAARRAAMLAKKENITTEIIEAIKAG